MNLPWRQFIVEYSHSLFLFAIRLAVVQSISLPARLLLHDVVLPDYCRFRGCYLRLQIHRRLSASTKLGVPLILFGCGSRPI